MKPDPKKTDKPKKDTMPVRDKDGKLRCPRCQWAAVGSDCDFCGLLFRKG